MKAYQVLVKILGEFEIVETGINLLYAESVKAYYEDHGEEVIIREI